MKESLVLRAALSPYVYTAAAAAHTSGVAAVRSMYIDHPDEEAAFSCPLQFMHGDDLLVRPVVSPMTSGSPVAVKLWLPPSPFGWASWNTSTVVPNSADGAADLVTHAGLRDLPLYARGGAAIPTLPLDTLSVLRNDAIVWVLIGGGERRTIHGSGTLYSDDGETTAYEQGVSATQTLRWSWNGSSLAVQIDATTGAYMGPATPRAVAFDLRGFGGVGELLAQAISGAGVSMACEATEVHSLARPKGAVVCTAKDKVGASEAMVARLSW